MKMKKNLWLACCTCGVMFGGCLGGCKTPDRTAATLATLQEGKARGHIVLVTPGSISAGQQTEFFFGARGSTLSFDGDVDFSVADFGALLTPATPAKPTE